jgi:trehalose/maltose hydrolase-like predicted phosphorylase
MADAHVAALETTFKAENWSGTLEVRSGLDGAVRNEGVERYQQLETRHLECLETGTIDDDSVFLLTCTLQSRIRIAEAARNQVFREGEAVEVERQLVDEDDYVAHAFTVSLDEGEELTVEKVVTLFTSMDRAISECGRAAREHLQEAPRFSDLLRRHVLAWSQNWRHAEIGVGEQENTDLAVNLYLCHTLQTVSENTTDHDVGIPARGSITTSRNSRAPCSRTASAGWGPPAGPHERPDTRAPCTRGRAAATGRRRARLCT